MPTNTRTNYYYLCQKAVMTTEFVSGILRLFIVYIN